MKDLTNTYLMRRWSPTAARTYKNLGGALNALAEITNENIFNAAAKWEGELAPNYFEGCEDWAAQYLEKVYYFVDLESADHAELVSLVSSRFLTAKEAKEVALETLGYEFDF